VWWWTKVKKATIPNDQRETFERYGENVIGMVLANGLNPTTGELYLIYSNPLKQRNARDWLTERSTWHERREDRLETLEWAILIFVFGELLFDLARAVHWLK
jgi:hypothetical protein